MSLFDNTVSVTRFKMIHQIEESKKVPFFDLIEQGLSSCVFQSIDKTSDQISVGWIPQGATSDFTFADTTKFNNAPYLFFSIRRDVRNIPYAAKQFVFAEKEKEWRLRNPGIKRLPKSIRAQFEESVTLELLAKTVPSPNMVDVVWNVDTNEIMLFATSPKWLEVFENLWRKSFPDFTLRAVTPFDHYFEAMPEEAKVSMEIPESYAEALDLYPHIGRDFLLWLTHESAAGQSQFESSICIADDKLVLVDEANKKLSVAISGEQSSYAEVIAALASGKSIAQANIKFVVAENEYRFVLKGKTFQFESFKCPKVLIERDASADELSEKQAVFYERMFLLETGFKLFAEVVKEFVSIHTTNWPAAHTTITKWYAGE